MDAPPIALVEDDGEGNEAVLITQLTTIGATGTEIPGIYVVTQTSTVVVPPVESERNPKPSTDNAATHLQADPPIRTLTTIIDAAESSESTPTNLKLTSTFPTTSATSTSAEDLMTSSNSISTAVVSSGQNMTTMGSSSTRRSVTLTAPPFNRSSTLTISLRNSTTLSQTSGARSTTARITTATTRNSTSILTRTGLSPTPQTTSTLLGDILAHETISSSSSSTAPASTAIELTQTFISAGITLTGSAAVSAIAAASESQQGESINRGSELSSYAIVGIVVGILVAFIIGYVVWYRWVGPAPSLGVANIKRKNKLRNANTGEGEDYNEGDDYFEDDDRRYREKSHVQSDVHSGFDFIDQPLHPASNRYTNTDPFADHLEYPHYPSSRVDTTRPTYDPARPESGLEVLESEVDQLGEALYSAMPPRPSRLTRQFSDTGDGTRHTHNPFDSPPSQIPRRASDLPDRLSRIPRVKSEEYGNIYDGYLSSRPPTHRGQDPFADNEVVQAKTPATSTLLPWLNPATPAPPIPAHVPMSPTSVHDDDYPGYTDGTAYDMVQANPVRQVRHPPRAAFASTPARRVQDVSGGGFPDIIPNFR